MDESSKKNRLLTEFAAERSIRRTANLLQEKRSRIRDDLKQLVKHLALLVPLATASDGDIANTDILIEAAYRLNDEVFAEMLIQIIKESQCL